MTSPQRAKELNAERRAGVPKELRLRGTKGSVWEMSPSAKKKVHELTLRNLGVPGEYRQTIGGV